MILSQMIEVVLHVYRICHTALFGWTNVNFP